MSEKDTTHKIPHKKAPPESIVQVDSAKRDIIRKGTKPHYRKDDIPGKIVDDGSTYDYELQLRNGAIDEKDPNYDPDEDEIDQEYIHFDEISAYDIGQSKMTLSEYKKKITILIHEYFVNGDIDEANNILSNEINAREYSYEFVKRIINMSFDKSDKERELVSQLLSYAYPNVLSTSMIGKGFERLFELIDDIEKDCPSAREMLSKYLTRAVIDEVLPPSFLSDAVISNLGGDIVEHAKRMLSHSHSGALLEHVWGPGDGRPVEALKVAVDQLVQEYLLSVDINEAARCIKELNSPFFFHEIVKRAITASLDKTEEKQIQISKLFKYLYDIGILTNSKLQVKKGFDKLYLAMPDLVLDTPDAKRLVDLFAQRAVNDQILVATYTPPPPRICSPAPVARVG